MDIVHRPVLFKTCFNFVVTNGISNLDMALAADSARSKPSPPRHGYGVL